MRDPLFKWDGPFPYDALAKVGITPTSTMQQVNDAGFELISKGMTNEERAAWDELRLVKRRLIVDFFLYQMDEAEWPTTDWPD